MQTTTNTASVYENGIQRGILEIVTHEEARWTVYHAYAILRDKSSEYLGAFQSRRDAEYETIRASYRDPLD